MTRFKLATDFQYEEGTAAGGSCGLVFKGEKRICLVALKKSARKLPGKVFHQFKRYIGNFLKNITNFTLKK